MRKHNGSRLVLQHYTEIQYEANPPSYPNMLLFILPVVAHKMPSMAMGASVDTVTFAFPVQVPLLYSPLLPVRLSKGSFTSRLDNRQLLSPSGCFCIREFLRHKENQQAWRPQWPQTHTTTPLLLTQILGAAGSTRLEELNNSWIHRCSFKQRR